MHRREFGRLATYTALARSCGSSVAQRFPSTGVRFSVMLWTLERLGSFDHCLEIVSQAGYAGVELVGEFQKWSPGERARIMARMRSLGLVFDAMSGVKAGFAVPDESEAFRTQFGEHMRAAHELECSKVILLSGRRVEGLPAGTQFQMSVDNLRWAAAMAAKMEIEITIEPIDLLENPTIFLSTVTEAFAMVRSVASPHVRVLYDFYHEQRSYGNLLEKLEKNIELIGLVHIADVPGRHDPGTGEIDYGSVYRSLAQLGYKQWIAMEYYPVGDPVASLRKARLDARQEMQA